jgi:response regulator NasT
VRVLIIDDSAERAEVVRAALSETGHDIIVHGEAALDLARVIGREQPDVIVIGSDSPARDTLEHLALASRDTPRPIVMFVEESDEDAIRAAIRAGVSAYIVDGLKGERLQSIIDVAVARFEAHRQLVEELDATRTKLAERPVIERAKGLLMQRRGVAEDEAYRLLRTMAMQKQKRLADVAQGLIDSAALLG